MTKTPEEIAIEVFEKGEDGMTPIPTRLEIAASLGIAEGDKAGYSRGLKSRTCQTCGHLADCCGACANNESKYWKNEGRQELAKELKQRAEIERVGESARNPLPHWAHQILDKETAKAKHKCDCSNWPEPNREYCCCPCHKDNLPAADIPDLCIECGEQERELIDQCDKCGEGVCPRCSFKHDKKCGKEATKTK